MKRFHLIYTILVLAASIQTNAQQAPTIADVRNSYYSYVFVFADNVNIRSAPSLDAEVLATVDEGTPLIHITTLGKMDTINGEAGNWTHILYQNQSAFVWSPLLTYKVLRSHQNPDVLFMIGPGPGMYESTIKVIVDGESVQELVFEGLKGYQGLEKWEITSNMGVDLVDEFLHFHYYAYACGKIGGELLFAWDGQQLRHFFTDWGIGDGGFFEGTRLILPAHPLGEKGVIHVFRSSGEQLFPEEEEAYAIPEIRFDSVSHDQYLWDGTQLVEMQR